MARLPVSGGDPEAPSEAVPDRGGVLRPALGRSLVRAALLAGPLAWMVVQAGASRSGPVVALVGTPLALGVLALLGAHPGGDARRHALHGLLSLIAALALAWICGPGPGAAALVVAAAATETLLAVTLGPGSPGTGWDGAALRRFLLGAHGGALVGMAAFGLIAAAPERPSPGVWTVEVTRAGWWHAWMLLVAAVDVGVGVAVVGARAQASQRAWALRAMAAADAIRRREAFLADLSHEIRTPLMAITHLHELLERREAPPDVRELVQQASKASDHLVALLNDTLDLARLNAGRMQVERKPFDLEALVHDAVGLARPLQRHAEVRLTVRVSAGSARVRVGDPRRLRQVLLNLVGNALKFTERGEVRVSVTAVGPTAVRFEVTDEGIGMSPAQIEKIFQAFGQADASVARRFGGSGLGLNISQRLVQRFGGTLTVESAEGRGSTFRFTLELPPAPPGAEVVPPARVDPHLRALTSTDDTTGSASLRLHVLLAEDTVVNQWVLQRALEALGHTVEVVGDGRAAIEAWRRRVPDVILMDVEMPEMDGPTATAHIRAMEPGGGLRVPILAVSGHGTPDEIARCTDAGMDGYLLKPVRSAELQAAMLDALKRRVLVPQVDRLPVR